MLLKDVDVSDVSVVKKPANGLRYVPVQENTKVALESGWDHKSYSRSEMATKYPAPQFNWGIHLQASHVVSIDVDNTESFQKILDEFGLDLGSVTPTIKTPKGYRVYFREPNYELKYHSYTLNGKTVFELRGGRGTQARYDLCPPSEVNGIPYSWNEDNEPDGFPEMPTWLSAIWTEFDKFKPQIDEILGVKSPADKAPKKPDRPRSRDYQSESIIDKYTAENPLVYALERYGYIQKGKRWLYPHSSTGLPGVCITDDGVKAVSHHASDPMSKYKAFDAFDLFVEYDHHGDMKAAIKSLSKQFKSNQIMDKKVIPFFSNNVEKTYDLEDLQGLADKFQDAHKGHIRIQNSDREVYIYTDGVWRADNKGGRSRFRFISEFIDSCGDSKLAKKMKHQRGLARDMLDSCDRLSTDFNTRRELIVMSGNKTFDSKTGEVRDSSPDDLSTLCTKVRYNPNAKSKVWDDFLKSRFPDADVLSYFQRSVGSAIVGAREKNFFFLLGDGNDAKSTLKKIISEALGDYVAKDLPLRALVSDDRASARLQSSLANLENKKIAFVTECEKADLRDVAPLKQITGGDGISASGMYKDPRYIDPHARLFLIGNKRLDFDITDVAIVDRLRVIRLETIPLEVRDPDFFDKFVSDSNNLEAVLLWLIDCALEYKQNGLKNVPDIITEWTMEMLYDELPAAMLCCFEKDANSSLTYTEVESELKKSGFNTKDLNKTTIGISIKKLFDIEKSKSRIVTYKGIKTKSMIKKTTPVSQPAEKTGAEKTSDISECYDADHQLHQFSAENSEKNRISNLVDIEGEYRGAEIEKSEFLAGNAAKTGVTGARGIEHLDNKEEFSAPVFSEVKDNW